MTTLSEALESFQVCIKERELTKNSSLTLQSGYEARDGRMITQMSNSHSEVITKEKGTLPENTSPKDCESITKATRSEIAEMVTVCYDALDTYGKTPEQMKATIKLFCMVLEGRPIDKVREGFRHWVNRNSKLPTPADIVNIIDPPKQEWRPDWAAYVGLKQKIKTDWYYPSHEERDFLRRCEGYAIDRSNPQDEGDKLEHQARALMIAHGNFDDN